MSNRKNLFSLVCSRRVALRLFCVLLFLWSAGCGSRLGVYSLSQYENNWKGPVTLPTVYDPYYDFFDAMTAGSDDPYASASSQRFKDSEVTIRRIIPIPDDDIRSWDDFHMVFFYGHNNTIVPPHPDHPFDYSTYNTSTNTWTPHTGSLGGIGWGDSTPFDYWAYRPVTIANWFPAAVTYLYNEYTASLLGWPYDYSGITGYWREHWYDPMQSFSYERLGNTSINWLILHGCQAVITADEGGNYNPLGVNWFSGVQGKIHMVLGHWISYSLSYITYSGDPLINFANDLLTGSPPDMPPGGDLIQSAYFDTAPYHNKSAIAAEEDDATWTTSTMNNDRWTDPVPDIEAATVFSQRWTVSLGVTDQQWN
jgi:hypothetical protein